MPPNAKAREMSEYLTENKILDHYDNYTRFYTEISVRVCLADTSSCV